MKSPWRVKEKGRCTFYRKCELHLHLSSSCPIRKSCSQTLEVLTFLHFISLLHHLTSKRLDMAVLPSLNTFKVEVVVNGEALEEYDDPDASTLPPHIVTKYVEAQSESDFTIKYYFAGAFPKDHVVEAQTQLDGKIVACQYTSIEALRYTGAYTIKGSNSKRNGEWSIQKFRFSALDIGILRESRMTGSNR